MRRRNVLVQTFSAFTAVGFGVDGYCVRRLGILVLRFMIAFILADHLERTIRQALAVSGADPWFLLKSPLAVVFLIDPRAGHPRQSNMSRCVFASCW